MTKKAAQQIADILDKLATEAFKTYDTEELRREFAKANTTLRKAGAK